MKGFRFRLATVLRYRERIQQQIEWEMKDLLVARSCIEDELRALDEEILHVGECMSPAAGQIVSPRELALHGRFAQELSQRIKVKRQVLHACNEKIATKRQELVEATRSVKVLEQLRARLEEKFLREQRVAEQKQSDEVTHLKFSRISAGK